MSAIGGLFGATITDLRNPAHWLMSVLGVRATAAGQEVTPDKAMTLPDYWAALRDIAEDVGKLPLVLLRREGRGGTRATDHPLYRILHDEPNPEMGSMAFRETVNLWAESWGNGYAEIERTGMEVTAMWPIHPSRVRPMRDMGRLFYRVRNDDGTFVDLDPSDVFHLHGLASDGIVGYSVLEVAAEAIGLGLAAQHYGASFFGGSTAINGVLTTKAKLSPEQRNAVRESWLERYSGPNASGKPAILDGDWDFRRIDIPPEQAQFLETRRFQREQINRILRTPERTSDSERADIRYVVETLMPWFVRWEQEIKRKLIATNEPDLYAQHIAQALMRGDHAARANFYGRMFGLGAMSSNDIREREDMDPVDGGDIYFVPLNMIPSERAEEYADATIQKATTGTIPDQKNPTGEGGGEENQPDPAAVPAPDEDRADATARASVMRMLSPLCQRIANRVTKAMSAKHGKPGYDEWLAKFRGEMRDETRAEIEQPMMGMAAMLGMDAAATVEASLAVVADWVDSWPESGSGFAASGGVSLAHDLSQIGAKQ